MRIFRATSSARPASGGVAPRRVEMPALERSPSQGQYSWWCRAADVVPLWDPYGALFSVVLMVGLCGFCVKRVMDEE